MTARANREDWGPVAKILHWAMAVGITVMFVCGIAMACSLNGNVGLKFSVYQFHKSLGLALLCVALLRLIRRIGSADRPDPADQPKSFERGLAKVVHIGLYVCLIAQPLIGWAAVSASPLNIPTVIFGLFAVPPLGHADADLEKLLNTTHGLVACALLALLMLHGAAALWHHFVVRDETLLRMLPRSWWGARLTSTTSDRHPS